MLTNFSLLALTEHQIYEDSLRREAPWHSQPEVDQPPKTVLSTHPELELALEFIKIWSRHESPWLISSKSESRNGLTLEVQLSLTPRSAPAPKPAKGTSSGAAASILIVSGPVTTQIVPHLTFVYDEMPKPKFVVAVGRNTTPSSAQGVQNHYTLAGGIEDMLPVDLYIPGCPPKPQAIIDGLTRLIESIQLPPNQISQATIFAN